MLKIMGFFLETRGKKRRKNTVHMEEKKFEKKQGPDGIRTRDLRFYFRKFESRYNRNDPPTTRILLEQTTGKR